MYFRVDDKLHSHVKAIKAGPAALGLWVLSASWSASQLTDGWVPEFMALRLAGGEGEAYAAALVRAGLWHVEERDGEAGWQFHEWDEWQHTREYVEERQRRARERMARVRAQREGGSETVRANGERSSKTVRLTPTQPNPTHNNTAAGAADFESWWEGYPRKTGKTAAGKAYTKARQSASADELMAGLTNACAVWTAERTEARFIPHPATWLNQGRWADEQPSLPGTADTPAPRRTLALCPDAARGECDSAHPWEDARNLYHCQGA